MEEKKNSRPHSISWIGRETGSVTGVTDVISFDENSVVLETEQGMLTIRGKNLHVGKLTLEQGVVEMEGYADSIVYSSGRPAQKGSLLKRMFR